MLSVPLPPSPLLQPPGPRLPRPDLVLVTSPLPSGRFRIPDEHLFPFASAFSSLFSRVPFARSRYLPTILIRTHSFLLQVFVVHPDKGPPPYHLFTPHTLPPSPPRVTMFVAKAFLVASLALSASAMITPHHIARRADHHAIAARVAEPEPVVVAPVHVSPRKRAVKRCAAPSSSSLSSSATPTPTPSPSPAPVNNVGQDPPKQPSPPPSPSPAPAKENPPPSKPAPPPTKAPAPTTKAAPPPSPSPNPPSGGGGSGPTYSGDG